MRSLFTLVFIILIANLYCCDMFALMAHDGYNLSDHPQIVNQYFDFLISRSSESTNNDGYGIIAYKRGNPHLSSSHRWYKTGSRCWYGDGSPDPLDAALQTILQPENEFFLLIGHARNATGGNGSHPFYLNTEQNTFTFCHNGVIVYSLRQAIMNWLGEDWFAEYPSCWYGVFGEVTSFIDSELYMHYLVSSIISSGGDSWPGLLNAYSKQDLGGISPAEYLLGGRCSANMLFSDGLSLFAFKNTIPTSSQQLSWQEYNGITALKTQEPLANTLHQNQIVQFNTDGSVYNHTFEYEEEDEEFVPATGFYSQPNPFINSVDVYYMREINKDIDEDEWTDTSGTVIIYDIKGRRIRVLDNLNSNHEYSAYHWDGRLANGKTASAGVYFMEHTASGKTEKLVKLR